MPERANQYKKSLGNHRGLPLQKILLLALLLGLCACPGPDSGDKTRVIFERCDGNEISIQFEDPLSIGSNANRLFVLDDSTTLVVESGENTVSKIQGNEILTFADVGENRGPWAVWADANTTYVTNYTSDSVSVFDRNGQIVREWTDGFSSPSAVIGDSKHLYISNVAFDGTVFQTGFVQIFDRQTQTVVKTLESSALNPLFLTFVTIQENRFLGITNAGSFEFTAEGTKVGSEASFELWDLNDLDQSPTVVPLPLDVERKIGSPGLPSQIGDKLYFASGTEPVLFEFDLKEKEWSRGIVNPIRLRTSIPEALHFSDEWDGLIFVSAFNEDAMYIYDPMCEKVSAPISLDSNEDFLAGPHDISISESGKGYLILSLANLVTPFTIENRQ